MFRRLTRTSLFSAHGNPFVDIYFHDIVATLVLSHSDAEALRAKQKVTPKPTIHLFIVNELIIDPTSRRKRKRKLLLEVEANNVEALARRFLF